MLGPTDYAHARRGETLTVAGDTAIVGVTTPPSAALAAAVRRGLSFWVRLSLHPGVTRHSPRDPGPVCYQQQGNRTTLFGGRAPLNDDLRIAP